jgi:hypothetical protein
MKKSQHQEHQLFIDELHVLLLNKRNIKFIVYILCLFKMKLYTFVFIMYYNV